VLSKRKKGARKPMRANRGQLYPSGWS
jgi:hypothetical protein